VSMFINDKPKETWLGASARRGRPALNS